MRWSRADGAGGTWANLEPDGIARRLDSIAGFRMPTTSYSSGSPLSRLTSRIENIDSTDVTPGSVRRTSRMKRP